VAPQVARRHVEGLGMNPAAERGSSRRWRRSSRAAGLPGAHFGHTLRTWRQGGLKRAVACFTALALITACVALGWAVGGLQGGW